MNGIKTILKKELADHLKKLNLDFYWRSRNLIREEKAQNIKPPAKPLRKVGMGISMFLRQEHTSPVSAITKESDNPPKSENGNQKRNSPGRRF